LPECGRRSALAQDPVDQPPLALQRVRPAHALEAAHQGLVAGLQEQHPRVDAPSLDLVQSGAQVRREGPRPHVDDDGDAAHRPLRPGAQVDHGRQQ
jgi:hypothetical protein